jgi:hypothetical protein
MNNLNDIVTLSGGASLLKNSLLLLPRNKTNGALNSNSKVAVCNQVNSFLVLTARIQIPDASVQMILLDLKRIAVNLSQCRSDSNGGYLSIETLFAEVMSKTGFLCGYLYALCTLSTMKRAGQDLNRLF